MYARILVLFAVIASLNGSGALAQSHLALEQCVRNCYHRVIQDPARLGDCVNLPLLASEINSTPVAIIDFVRIRTQTSLRRYPNADIANLQIISAQNSEYYLRGTLINGWMGIPFPLRIRTAFNGGRCVLLEASVWGTTLAEYLEDRVR